MPRFVVTAKVGANGVGVAVRDTVTGMISSFTIAPKEFGEAFLREMERAAPELVAVKWE